MLSLIEFYAARNRIAENVITGDSIVWIEAVWSKRKAVNYLCKYIAKNPVSRIGYSGNFLPRGYAKAWKEWVRTTKMINLPMEYTIHMANNYLKGGERPEKVLFSNIAERELAIAKGVIK